MCALYSRKVEEVPPCLPKGEEKKENFFSKRILLYRVRLFLLFFFTPLFWRGAGGEAFSQINYSNHDNKPYHFGFSLAYNTSKFKVVHSEAFNFSDSVLSVHSTNGPGFNIGIIGDMNLGEHFNFRFIPALSFAEKNLEYITIDTPAIKTVESVYIEAPFLFKFKSDRVKDFRVYVVGGFKYAYDLSSNKSRRISDMVKIEPHNFNMEMGVGMDFYFPMFKFSPEIKLSKGLTNILVEEESYIYSNVLDKLFARSLVFSFHVE